jgi:hypothetical protein
MSLNERIINEIWNFNTDSMQWSFLGQSSMSVLKFFQINQHWLWPRKDEWLTPPTISYWLTPGQEDRALGATSVYIHNKQLNHPSHQSLMTEAQTASKTL